jgi:hypothetical protein
MTLSSTLKPLFNAGDRSRGASYHNRGSVHSIRVNDGLLVAEVDGSYGFYEVTLDVVDFDNERAISCTCPRFDGGFYCKHIWATILKYESVYGRLRSASTPAKPKPWIKPNEARRQHDNRPKEKGIAKKDPKMAIRTSTYFT